MMEYYSALKTICNDVDGARGYYAKLRKSVRKRLKPYDLTHAWNLRKKQRVIEEGIENKR